MDLPTLLLSLALRRPWSLTSQEGGGPLQADTEASRLRASLGVLTLSGLSLLAYRGGLQMKRGCLAQTHGDCSRKTYLLISSRPASALQPSPFPAIYYFGHPWEEEAGGSSLSLRPF